jgi:four helix bundle protein
MNKKNLIYAHAPRRLRCESFAYIRLFPKTTEARVLGTQVFRSGTSVGAHYREATRARSTAEFISKIEGGLQELEETVYWLELLMEANIAHRSSLHELLQEAEELIAILVASVKTAKTQKRA